MKIRTYFFSLIFFLFLLHIIFVSAADAAYKIMPLGNSITWDDRSNDTRPDGEKIAYRYRLWQLLTDAGYDFDFVGSQYTGFDIFPDAENEGHPGWTDDEILNGRPSDPGAGKLTDWLGTSQPDIVLLHIGTNGLDPSSADVEAILNEIDVFSPDVWVVLALIINRACSMDTPPCPEYQETMDFNDNVEAMALGRKNNPNNPAYPDKIIIVDMETGANINYNIQPAGDMWDNLHPFDTGYTKMADLWFTGLMEVLQPVAEIIGAVDSGISYWNVAAAQWTRMTSSSTTGDIAAGDFTADGKADVASIWDSGLWYQDGDTLVWTKVSGSIPARVTAGDVTGDGRAEIIGTMGNGIWYWDVAAAQWTQMTSSTTTGDIAAGDFTGDGKADVASIWDSGLWYQDGDTLVWTKVSGSAPDRVTAGDVTGDGRAEIIGTWRSGIWYWDVAAARWTLMTAFYTTGDIAAGDFTGDGKADVASVWNSGLWYQDGDTLAWTQVPGSIPVSLTAGDVTGK